MFSKSREIDRRTFVQLAGAACLVGAVTPMLAQSPPVSAKAENPMGLVVWIEEGQSIDAAIREVRDLGFPVCQVGFKHLTPDVVKPLQSALSKYGITATAFSEHGPGQRIFDFYQGPPTIGIFPVATRDARVHNLKLAADIASQLGIPAIHTHIGFTPEDPNDPLYPQTVAALREIAVHCKQKGIIFLCELGQETPITLVRLIEDVGTGNVFVNLDFANLICYGKGNPVDAMDVLGERVRGTHAKDAVFPTDPWNLGKTVPFGEGKVDFPTVFAQLRKVNYSGPILIEHGAQSEKAREEILRRKAFLGKLMGTLSSSQGAV
ncbi:MAG: sugar phosphate isomerase/epimerase family protein [Acidobacteriaceae bacterium]